MRKYQVLLEPTDDGWFVATVPELPGCVSQGKNRADALKNIKEAIQLMTEDGKPSHREVVAVLA